MTVEFENWRRVRWWVVNIEPNGGEHRGDVCRLYPLCKFISQPALCGLHRAPARFVKASHGRHAIDPDRAIGVRIGRGVGARTGAFNVRLRVVLPCQHAEIACDIFPT